MESEVVCGGAGVFEYVVFHQQPRDRAGFVSYGLSPFLKRGEMMLTVCIG